MNLFWLLCAGLLLAGTVEAGETIGQKAIREAGSSWVPCSQMYGPADQECRVSGDMIETRQPCYQRMREAMTAMDAYRPAVDRYGNIIAFDGFDRVKRDAIGAITQWDRVMRECVK